MERICNIIVMLHSVCYICFKKMVEVEVMQENTLSVSFADSLNDNVVNVVGDAIEVGLDAIVDDGILKEIPLVSTVISIYKIGDSIKERHNLKKLAVFIQEINQAIVSEEQKEEYRNKFRENENFRNNQLKYILVLIDRYITYDKPQMLAKLFLAYLDGRIVWEELVMYAEVIDRFLLLDHGTLVADSNRFIVHRNIGGESILRLVALGLMTEESKPSAFKETGGGNIGMTWESLSASISKDRVYVRTEFGEKLSAILR